MENASKALIMVSSILIGVMILAFMVYMFSDASKLNKRHEVRESEKEISAFNAKFQVYESFTDRVVNPSNGNLYTSADYITYARTSAAKNLNVISDVVTAVNEAYDINYQNSNRYLTNDYIEYENGMVIVIDLKSDNLINDFAGSGKKSKAKYVIFPNAKIESGYIYGMTNAQYDSLMTKINNHDKNIDISPYQKVSLSKFLEVFRESRLSTTEDDLSDFSTYTLYKYYFAGSIHINSETQKIDKVIFTLVKDTKY